VNGEVNVTDLPIRGLFHTGVIVDDLELAMVTWSAAFGIHWAEPLQNRGELVTTSGVLPRESRLTYSLEGPHHLELIEHVDATAWEKVTGGPKVHHLGFHVSDLQHEIERLAAIGFVPEAQTAEIDSQRGYCFLRDPNSGMWIELVGPEVHDRVMDFIERNRA
jgi:catechol 2,3-dioxygenase-like lactoylglutathione lyase family enzyme